MATTMLTGSPVTAAGLLHTGAGRLLGFLLSSDQAGAQEVVFYDATTAAPGSELLVVQVPTGVVPFYVMFPRELAPAFATGLYVDPNSATVAVWAVLRS